MKGKGVGESASELGRLRIDLGVEERDTTTRTGEVNPLLKIDWDILPEMSVSEKFGFWG